MSQALDMGAVDYIVKPFPPMELAARIRAALRRREVSAPLPPFVLGDLTVHYDEREAHLAGNPLKLTAIEYRVLAELATSAGRVLTYEHLLRHVWGGVGDGDIRPLHRVVSRVRRKLGDDLDNPTYIFTEPRVGYRMARETSSV